jgi:hypothetical protein
MASLGYIVRPFEGRKEGREGGREGGRRRKKDRERGRERRRERKKGNIFVLISFKVFLS